ncbi:MAG: ribonuclease P protein component, partial [Dehalococcoidia bacterium]
MGKGERLTGRKPFTTVYSQGQTWTNRLLVLKALPNGLDNSRWGFAAGKRLGNAVTRNRIKRWLRESVRQSPSRPGWDLILVARNGTVTSDYHQVKAAVEDLLSRAALF